MYSIEVVHGKPTLNKWDKAYAVMWYRDFVGNSEIDFCELTECLRTPFILFFFFGYTEVEF